MMNRRQLIGGGLGLAFAAGLAGCKLPFQADDSRLDALTGFGIPSPKAFLRSNWSRDPFSRCAYSYLAPDPLGIEARRMLARPVSDRLFFAGEATSIASPATVHGALKSGWRAAGEASGTLPGGSRVTVIGAGASGLACARSLLDAGHEVTVLEARDRIGGRVHTERIEGAPVEMGAAWIHGVEDNPIAGFAADQGVETVPFAYEVGFPRSWQAAPARRGQRMVRRAVDSFDWQKRDPATTPVAELLPRRQPLGLQWAADYEFSQEYGAGPEDLAVLATDEGRWYRGGDALIKGSYADLLIEAAGDVPVRTGKVVVAVEHGRGGVGVTLRDGERVASDAVVVTVPIGCLKAGDITFDPPLPRPNRRAIRALGAGLLDKLCLAFDEVFWDPDAETIGWIDPETPGLWGEWVNCHRLTGQPILLGYNGGGIARGLAGETDETVLRSGMAALGAMYG